jgi:signal transduction histidine kinase
MLGWVRMLQTGTLEPPLAARALEVIDRNTKLQAQLLDDLLDVSRIVTGTLRLDFRAVDVVAVVEAALETVGRRRHHGDGRARRPSRRDLRRGTPAPASRATSCPTCSTASGRRTARARDCTAASGSPSSAIS